MSNTPLANHIPFLGQTVFVQPNEVAPGVGSNSYVVAAGTNTITAALSPAITAYTTGMQVVVVPANDNTGAATLNLNGLGAKAVKKFDGATALASGDLQAGQPALLVYDGTNFCLVNAGTTTNPMSAIGQIIYGGAGGAASALAANTTTTRKYLSETGDGSAGAAPAWRQLNVNDLSGTAGTAAGTDTYTISLGGGAGSYFTGMFLSLVFTNANTGAATLNVNSLGAKAIKKNAGADALAAADITAGSARLLVYDGTQFQLINVA